MKSNNKGFSLVEMIIVIAVIAILAGASVTFFGHVRYANTQKTVESIDSAIDKLQSNAMSKSNNSYLYIYKLSDGYYMKTVDTYYDTFATSIFDTNGTKIADKQTEIYIDSETGTLVDGTNFVCIRYKKSGVFDDKTNASKLVIKGNGTYTIALVKETGKHPVLEG